MPAVTTQEIVAGVLNRLPPDVSLEQVARELEFIAAVREGFAQLDQGVGIPLEEVERLMPTWIRTSPPRLPSNSFAIGGAGLGGDHYLYRV